MIRAGEGELTADLWQYYNIKNWREERLVTVATLAVFLPLESRIKRKLAGLGEYTLDQILLATAVDRLTSLLYTHARKGTKRPESIAEKLMNQKADKKDSLMTFSSGEEYEKARRRIIEGGA